MQAMSAGAVDIITKPKTGLKNFLEESHNRMIHVLKAAGQAKVVPMAASAPAVLPVQRKLRADAMIPHINEKAMAETTDRVVAIGTSTGGTQALERVLARLPRTAPGIVVVQHMPEQFTAAFAARLDKQCEVRVKEAVSGDRVIPGHVLIANGGKHMLLRRSGAQYRTEIKDGPLVSRHRPSVDVLFRSVANAAGANALGVIMTGMGDDGAHGLKEMHDAGAHTLAQNEQSCVVYGMPKEAVKLGAVDQEVALDEIAGLIMDVAS
jgi:two-component system chemotaxis response regulator CheB